jgi:phosphotransferase system HPr (HPr) family protein
MGDANGNVQCQREVKVRNKEGLHFRPIMQLVDTAAHFCAKITVRHEDRAADARSPMELLMLVATHGSSLTLEASGADADAALDALAELFEAGFGED